MDSAKQDILKAFYPTFIGVLIGLVLGGLLWMVVRTPRGDAVKLLPPPTQAPLMVDVSGAVPRPGVYELRDGSRVKDALQLAGGFLAQADKSQVNLAAPVTDGQKLEIPYISGLEPTPISVSSLNSSNSSGNSSGSTTGSSNVTGPATLVDINTATVDELDTLPGIGPTLAQAIIDYREQNGPFLAIEDIMFVPGIGDATFEAIQGYITVGY